MDVPVTDDLANMLAGWICTGTVFLLICLFGYAITHRSKPRPADPEEPEED